MSIKAIIFDLDGTLLDTLLDIANSMNAVLQRNGFEPKAVENYRYYVGEGMQMLAKNVLAGTAHSDEDAARLAAEMTREYSSRWHEATKPYQGIPELLGELSKKGTPIAILSNKPDNFTKEMVRYFFPGVAFEPALGARTHIPRKPDPSGALEILQGWNMQAGEVAFIGDSKIDMQTAVKAGMLPAGVLWGFRDREELLAHGAKHLLARPEDLLKLL